MLSAELQEIFVNNRRLDKVINQISSLQSTILTWKLFWDKINTRILLPASLM